MVGLKNVRNRRTDALTQVGWDQLETMLAVYYRGQGYRVDHVGTGATGARFDGGIDLKLFRDDAYIVVQCKHWNAKQVTHNAVHELLGVMVTQGATGAILVTSGEFSRYAIEAATKQGHVQLVDGDDLRMMLGSLPELAPVSSVVSNGRYWVARGVASPEGERLLGAAEDRIRAGGRRRGAGRGRGVFGHAMDAGLGILLIKLLVGLIIFLVMTNQITSILGGLKPTPTKPVGQAGALPVPGNVPDAGVLRSMQPARGTEPVLIDHYSGTTVEYITPGATRYQSPTAAEMREQKRRADEAMHVLQANTPEM